MFYKLKTDLPTFKAGDIFYLDQNGSLRHKETDIVAYHYSTLEKFPDALEKFWEPVEEEFKRWRAEHGKYYYCVETYGVVDPKHEGGWAIDDDRYNIGDYFRTAGEAKALIDYLKALAVVREDAKGFVPDWSDGEQAKVYVGYSHYQEDFLIGGAWHDEDNGVFGLPYFATVEDAQASIKKHKAEWLTIFGVKGESDDYEE